MLKVSKMTSLKIYMSPVMEKPAHNHLTNLFISSYRGAAVIKFEQQKQLPDRSRQGTFPLGVVTSLSFDHMILINLCISSYREATGATFIHTNAQVVIVFLLQIFCDNKIQQILLERQMPSWQLTCFLCQRLQFFRCRKRNSYHFH